MNILMVGGTGTISYDATKFFLEKGHKVFLLNRGNRNNLKHENLQYIIGDANNNESLNNALEGKLFDVILDFIIFTKEQLEKRLAVYNGHCKQFVFISSATAYKLIPDTITEETPLGNDNWKYSKDKRECEEYLQQNSKEFDFSFTIVRPYITYDDRRIPFPVITKESYYTLLDRINHEKPVIVCGDGTNKLTLTNTKDFAVALEGLLLNSKAYNQAFHITGDCVTSWNEIVDIISKKLKKNVKVVYIPISKLAEYYPSEKFELLYDKSCDHVFDNSKICDAVPDFKTTISVEEGLNKTIDNLLTITKWQKIDYIWNDIIDTILEKYQNEAGNIKYNASFKSKLNYWIFQKSNIKILKKVIKKYYKLKGGV